MNDAWYKSGQDLLDEIGSYEAQTRELTIWYIGQMGIMVKTREASFMIDPVLNDLYFADGSSRRNYKIPFTPQNAPKLDFMIGTHNHADHLNRDTYLPILENQKNVKLIVPKPLCESISEITGHPEKVIGAECEKAISLSEHLSVIPIPVAHEEYHYDEAGNTFEMGVLIRYYDKCILHTGDTVLTELLIQRICKESRIDLLFVPINGIDYERRARGIVGNMSYQDAAHFANQVNADLVIPMHYDMVIGNGENPLTFAAYMQEHFPARKFHVLKLGEKIVL